MAALSSGRSRVHGLSALGTGERRITTGTITLLSQSLSLTASDLHVGYFKVYIILCYVPSVVVLHINYFSVVCKMSTRMGGSIIIHDCSIEGKEE